MSALQRWLWRLAQATQTLGLLCRRNSTPLVSRLPPCSRRRLPKLQTESQTPSAKIRAVSVRFREIRGNLKRLAVSWRRWRVLITNRVNWRLCGYIACGEGPIRCLILLYYLHWDGVRFRRCIWLMLSPHAVLQKADSETSEQVTDSCENQSDFGAVLINPGQFEAAMLWRRWQVLSCCGGRLTSLRLQLRVVRGRSVVEFCLHWDCIRFSCCIRIGVFWGGGDFVAIVGCYWSLGVGRE